MTLPELNPKKKKRCELLELTFENAWPLIKEIPALWSKLDQIGKLRSGTGLIH
jgi:hypothetical protein